MFNKTAKLEKAFRRHPRAPLFARLADAYLRRGKTMRALALCEEGCATFPDYATGFFVLSRCHEAQGQLEEAREALDRGLRLDPRCPAPYRQLSRVYGRMGNATLARKCLEAAVELDPLSAALAQELASLPAGPGAADQPPGDDSGQAGVAAPDPDRVPRSVAEAEAAGASPSAGEAFPPPDDAAAPDRAPPATQQVETAPPAATGATPPEPAVPDQGPPAAPEPAEPAMPGQEEVAALGEELADLLGNGGAGSNGADRGLVADGAARGDDGAKPPAPVSVEEPMPSPDAAASADGGGRGGEFLPPLRAGSDDEPAAPSPATAPPPFHAESEPPASEVGGRRAAAVARFGDGDEELDALLGDLGAGAGSASAPEAVGNDGGPVPPIPTPTLARLYAEQGFADRAAHVYRQVLEVRPDDAEARAALAGLEGH